MENWKEMVDEVFICYCGSFFFLLIEKVEGVYIYIIDGCVILDFIFGQMCVVFGYNYLVIVVVL